MDTITINQNRNLATVLHLSVFTKYFIPLGNFIFPLLLWMMRKDDPFVDRHGRNALNFQISMFLYTVLLLCLGAATIIFFGLRLSLEEFGDINQHRIHIQEIGLAIPFIITISVFGIILLALFILEIFTVISASINASEGKEYHYPLTINFISSGKDSEENHQSNQSENEQFNQV